MQKVLPKIHNGSDLYYYEEMNPTKLDDLILRSKGKGRHNHSVYDNSNTN